MQRLRRNWGSSLLVGAALALLLGASACTDDLYASCSLERDRCGDPGAETLSCAEKNNLQCETQVCARYEGSEPYCTVACEDDGDCTAGVCRVFNFSDSSSAYCVEETDA